MRGRRIRVLRAAALIALALFLLVAGLLDVHYRRWPNLGYAFAIDRGAFVAATHDWPGVWRGALGTAAGRDISEALAQPIADLERQARLSSGIRPTPSRWSLWMGKQLVASTLGEHRVVCLRPGIAARAYFRFVMQGHASKGPQPWGEWDILWRDGYLLIGDRGAPLAEVEPLTLTIREGLQTGAPQLSIHLPSLSGGRPLSTANVRVILAAEEGFPFRIEFPFPAPMPTVGAVDPGRLDIATVDAFVSNFQLVNLVSQFDWMPAKLNDVLLPHLIAETPLADANATFAARLCLFDLPSSAGEGLPHTGASIYRAEGPWVEHPLSKDNVHPPNTRIPYRWGETDGFVLPRLGEDFTYGCAVAGQWAHIASPPANVAPLLQQVAPDPSESNSIARLDVHWEAVAKAYEANRRQRVALGMAPGDTFSFDRDYGGWVRAIGALGRTHLVGDSAGPGNAFRLTGFLADRGGME